MHSNDEVTKEQHARKSRKRSRFGSSLPSTAKQPPSVVAPVANLRAVLKNEQNLATLSYSQEQADQQKQQLPHTGNLPNEKPSGKRPRRANSRFASATVVAPRAPSVTPNPVPTAPPANSFLTNERALLPSTNPSTVFPNVGGSTTPAIDVTAIPIMRRQTLRINQKEQKKKKLKEVLKITEKDLLDTNPRRNPFFDPALARPSRLSRPLRKDITFVEHGTIIAEAEKQRERATVEENRAKYTARLMNAEAQTAAQPILPPLAEDLTLPVPIDIPTCEWWDLPFILKNEDAKDSKPPTGSKDAQHVANGVADPMTDIEQETTIQLREVRITHYIHHPPPITPAKRVKKAAVLPLMLTKKEQKKLRRQRRMESQKEQQEMIAAGLLPPPPPKVKLSNMVRVLATTASADPTKVEEQVRLQVEARRLKHEADNEARKKSGEERREILRGKRKKDRDAGLYAAVFRVANLSNASHRFKVDRNARQLDMTGMVTLFDGCNAVVVEGGSKAIQKYKTLMLRRIKWDESHSRDPSATGDGVEGVRKEEDSMEERKGESLQKGQCVLVWEGVISSTSFETFSTTRMRDEESCRNLFRKHQVEHYWDLCMQASPLGNTKLGVRKM